MVLHAAKGSLSDSRRLFGTVPCHPSAIQGRTHGHRDPRRSHHYPDLHPQDGVHLTGDFEILGQPTIRASRAKGAKNKNKQYKADLYRQNNLTHGRPEIYEQAGKHLNYAAAHINPLREWTIANCEDPEQALASISRSIGSNEGPVERGTAIQWNQLAKHRVQLQRELVEASVAHQQRYAVQSGFSLSRCDDSASRNSSSRNLHLSLGTFLPPALDVDTSRLDKNGKRKGKQIVPAQSNKRKKRQ